jgi:hypothetical protein
MVLSNVYSGSDPLGRRSDLIDEPEQATAPRLKAIIGFM